jgi:hypothetical protein
MKTIYFITLFLCVNASASIMGISNHPLGTNARLLSAEITGHMSQRNEMAAGLRYTQKVSRKRIFDLNVSGGQSSRGLQIGSGMDFELLPEKLHLPKVSIKAYHLHQRFESQSHTSVGLAPAIKKSFGFMGKEFFPYLATPLGIKINSLTSEFVYQANLTIGASLFLPGDYQDKILLSIEGNKNFGASSDFVGCLFSWIWK